ncbi:DUF5412 domain-containing protein [Candidatus Pristimantibacillus sp. PTI5]|uniref:DUF5412 domain-containing protein n=1 Tax=Candidatus Pristimantibacillus sp. PTI5 TaxID=3400422 RepID=UPI003B01A873
MDWNRDEGKEIKKQKRKIIKKILITLGIMVTAIMILTGYGVYRFFYDMNHLPKGDLIDQANSPSGRYRMNAYLVNGGATVDFAIRGELVDLKKKNKPRNIYWNYHESESDIRWLDDQTVIINGHELNVITDKFDFRNGK